MKFIANINVMPLKALLDPQGKVVTGGLHNMGINSIENVRIGKHITLEIEEKDKTAAEKTVEKACKELLHNPIMESFEYTLVEVK